MVKILEKTENHGQFVSSIKWMILLSVVALSFLTLITIGGVERFEVETKQLLQDSAFNEAGNHWVLKGAEGITFEDGEVTISNRSSGSRRIFQNIVIDKPAFYRISYTAAVDEVVPARQEEWSLASVVVINRDKLGQRVGTKSIARHSGTMPAQYYSENLLLTESVASIDFVVRLLQASGTFTVSDPTVSRLKELTTYKYLRGTVVLAWIALLFALGYSALTVFSVSQVLLFTAIACVVLIGTMMPEGVMTQVTQKVSAYLPENFMDELAAFFNKLYMGGKSFNDGATTSKLGHLAAFFLVGLFVGSFWRKCGIFYAVAAIATFAFATEALQILVFGRTTSVGDLIVDCIGGLVGLFFGALVVEIKKIQKKY